MMWTSLSQGRGLVGYLGWGVGFYFGSLVAWTLLKGSRPRHAKLWMIWLRKYENLRAKAKRVKEKTQDGLAWYGSLGFILLMSGAFLVLSLRHQDYPTVEKHNVEVLQKVGPDQWTMRDDQGLFLFTACPDFPNSRVIQAGYIAAKVRWEEQGYCKSIQRDDLGFWWVRNPKNPLKVMMLNHQFEP